MQAEFPYPMLMPYLKNTAADEIEVWIFIDSFTGTISYTILCSGMKPFLLVPLKLCRNQFEVAADHWWATGSDRNGINIKF